MKKSANTNLVLSGIFVATLAFSLAQAVLSYAQSETAAPEQTASAEQPPAAPTVTVAPAKAPELPPIKILNAAEEERLAAIKSMKFSLQTVYGIEPDEKGYIKPSSDWSVTKSDSEWTYAFKNNAMFVQNIMQQESERNIVTFNRVTDVASITVMRDKKPESYTQIYGDQHFTVTPGFCKILKEQTGSKSFKEMEKTAFTCRDFYSRAKVKPEDQELIQYTLDTDRRNLQLLTTTVAASKVPKARSKGDDLLYKLKSTVATPSEPRDPTKARPILSKTSSPEDIADRQAIAAAAAACNQLWNDGDINMARPKPAPAKASANSTKSSKDKTTK